MIVIDREMPNRCADCPCFDDNVYGHCRVLDRWLDARDGAWFAESRPEWCPLKEHDKQQFFVDENGKITPLPVVVRCKDCKHRPIKPKDIENGFDLKFPDGKCPCQCDDGWYSWYPSDDWFCPDGERRTDE